MLGLKKNARSVYDSGSCLNYYHVSLQPAEWYQWFDPLHREDGKWMQVI